LKSRFSSSSLIRNLNALGFTIPPQFLSNIEKIEFAQAHNPQRSLWILEDTKCSNTPGSCPSGELNTSGRAWHSAFNIHHPIEPINRLIRKDNVRVLEELGNMNFQSVDNVSISGFQF